jgi:hypothetical protein
MNEDSRLSARFHRHSTLFSRRNRDSILSTRFDRHSTLLIEINEDSGLSFKFLRNSSAEISQTHLEKFLADTAEKCWGLAPGIPHHIGGPDHNQEYITHIKNTSCAAQFFHILLF